MSMAQDSCVINTNSHAGSIPAKRESLPVECIIFCRIIDVVISKGIPQKDKICPVFLRPSAIYIWRKGALALCTLTLLSKIDLQTMQCTIPRQ